MITAPRRSPSNRSGAVTRAVELRAEAQELRDLLASIINPSIKRRVQILIDELEAEARALDNGDAEE